MSRQPVVGGAIDRADPAVVALAKRAPSCAAGAAIPAPLCSGTLIAPRVVLTAAHCLDQATADGLVVFFGDDLGGTPAAVVELAVPAAWQTTGDLALLRLATPAAVASATIDARPLDASAVGATVRIVGFGADDVGTLGVKRDGTATITAVSAGELEIAAGPAMSCAGDSGGPVLLDRGDGEVVIGVTSAGDLACTTGVNTRVDLHVEALVTPFVATDPPPRPALEADADLCASPCTDDDDCPIGTTCLAGSDATRTCGFSAAGPGRFGAACGVDGDCGGGVCLDLPDGCRCWRACDAGGDDGGCAVGGARSDAPSLLALLAVAGWLARSRSRSRRRRRRGRRVLGALLIAGGCRGDGGACPPDTAAKRSAAQEWCEDRATGAKEGRFAERYDDGTKRREGAFRQGKPDGAWTAWHPNRATEWQVAYADGVMVGVYTAWYENGRIKETGVHTGGARDGVWHSFYEEDGARWRDTTYARGGREERWTVWRPDGSRWQDGVFVDGKKDGPSIEWHPNGRKRAEGSYRAGTKVGTWVAWDEQGVTVGEETFP